MNVAFYSWDAVIYRLVLSRPVDDINLHFKLNGHLISYCISFYPGRMVSFWEKKPASGLNDRSQSGPTVYVCLSVCLELSLLYKCPGPQFV